MNEPANLPDSVQKARDFAIAAHGDQKYGDHPYIYHLDAVHEIVRDYGDDARVVAYLHDVVEDTTTKIEQIEDVFGDFVARCVAAVTDEPGRNRRIRKRDTNAKLKRCDISEALIVKVADRLANLRECVSTHNHEKAEMYWFEHGRFRDAVYRTNLFEHVWQEIDSIISSISGKRDIEELEEQAMSAINKLREIKAANPSLKKGFAYCPGGILNAYREGDVTFDEAVAHLKECNTPAAEARRVAITALEVTLKKLKAGA